MADPAASEETSFQAPTYTISLISDGTLQFDPPQDSPELAIALSLAFPRPRTLDEKMREAQLLFLRTRHQTTAHAVQQGASAPTSISTLIQPTTHVETTRLNAEQVIQEATPFHVFDSSTQQPAASSSAQSSVENKSKKRARKSRAKTRSQPYDLPSQNQFVWDFRSGQSTQKRVGRTLGEAEAVQVFENRGNVCDYHKKNKTKCVPNECLGNKLSQRTMPPSLPLVSKTFPENPSGVHDAETRQLQGRKVTAKDSHPPSVDPIPTAEGRNALAQVSAATGVPDPNHDKPLEQEILNWPIGYGEDDGMVFLQDLDGLHPPSVDDNFPVLDSGIPLCGRLNLYTYNPNYEHLGSGPKSMVQRDEEEEDEMGKRKKSDEEEDSIARSTAGSGGGGSGGGGFGDPNGRGGNNGDGGGNGGAAGGTGGSGSNGSSYDPFWGFDGDGYGWYSSMVAVFMLLWFALRSLRMATSAQPPTGIEHLEETTKSSISNTGVGFMDKGHWSSDRGADDKDDDGATGGARCSSSVVATDVESHEDSRSLTIPAKYVFNPATTPGRPQDILSGLFNSPGASLRLEYPYRLSILSSTISIILPRMQSKTLTKTMTRTTTGTSTSPCTSSTLDHRHDPRVFTNSSRSISICASSALRAF